MLEYPLAASDKPGWDLAAEFVNMHLGTGGEFFAEGSADLAIDNDNGRKVLETLRAMTTFMNPDYLTFDANEPNRLWDAGSVALMTQWGSLAGAAIDPATANAKVEAGTGFAAAPTIGGGTVPAAAPWWNGFTITKNISDEDAAASFQAMVHGISPETVAANPDAATWLVAGFEPGPSAVGVIGNAKGGAPTNQLDRPDAASRQSGARWRWQIRCRGGSADQGPPQQPHARPASLRTPANPTCRTGPHSPVWLRDRTRANWASDAPFGPVSRHECDGWL